MIEPMQVRVAAALPEMEPNTAHATIAAALRPPRTRPTTRLMRSTSGAAIFPRSMTPPARMNSGIASRITVFIFQ